MQNTWQILISATPYALFVIFISVVRLRVYLKFMKFFTLSFSLDLKIVKLLGHHFGPDYNKCCEKVKMNGLQLNCGTNHQG